MPSFTAGEKHRRGVERQISSMARKQITDCVVERHLRGGAYGELWRGRTISTGEVVNVRVVNRWAADDCERLRREVQILRRLSHENVVQFKDLKKTATRFYMVFEACTGGDLAQLLRLRGSLPEAIASHFLAQIAAGLRALHHKVGEYHGDLRPGNIFLACSTRTAHSCNTKSAGTPPFVVAQRARAAHASRGSMPALAALPALKLACLGAKDSKRKTASPYTAPEVLRGGPLSKQADLWAVGVIYHELLTGTTPFIAIGNHRTSLLEAMSRGLAQGRSRGLIGGGSRRLLEALLEPKPEGRPDAGEVVAITKKYFSAMDLLEDFEGILSEPLTVGEDGVTLRNPLCLEGHWNIAAISRNSSMTELAPILEADSDVDEFFDLIDDKVFMSPVPVRTQPSSPDSQPAPTAVNIKLPLTSMKQAINVTWPLSVPEWPLAAKTIHWASQSCGVPWYRLLFGRPAGEAARVFGGSSLFHRCMSFVNASSGSGRRPRKTVGPYRAALPHGQETETPRDPVTAFCVGELKKSHLFRLRTARLFPRILYAI